MNAVMIKPQPSVLIVDDEPQVLAALKDTLEDEFRVLTITSPKDAIKLLEQEQELSVIMSDQRMPEISGHEFLAWAREISEASRILITGYSDIDAVIAAVNDGKIFGYVSKPWDPTGLKLVVYKAVEHYALAHALRVRLEQQAAVARLGQFALVRRNSEKIEAEAVALVAHTLNVEYCKVMVKKPDRNELLLRTGFGWHEGIVGHATVKIGKTRRLITR
jgi:Response regulator containing CheY-like receiver, AAA-type ATPase, and DNA-binding domains